MVVKMKMRLNMRRGINFPSCVIDCTMHQDKIWNLVTDSKKRNRFQDLGTNFMRRCNPL